MSEFLAWFTGGANYTYHNLIHCMDGDYVMIGLVVAACIGVFAGYMMIAYKWSMAAKAAPDGEAKSALTDLKWIFLLCGICGYLWVVMEVFWLAWRAYFIFLLALNFFTWRYVLKSIKGLEQVYSYLQDRDQLVREIIQQRAAIKRLEDMIEKQE